MSPKLVLLPCQGAPIKRVWLPPTRLPSDLVVTPRLSDSTVGVAFRRKAEELGLTEAVLRPLGSFEVDVLVWVCWVRPGEAPRGMDEVPVQEVANHAVFGRMIRRIQEAQARS